MTIKIKKLSIEKDGFIPMIVCGKPVSAHKRLKGNISVKLSEGLVTGNSEVRIDAVSEGLRDELYSVLNKIEDELNGVATDDGSGGETINITFNISSSSANSSDIGEFAKKITEAMKRQQGLR